MQIVLAATCVALLSGVAAQAEAETLFFDDLPTDGSTNAIPNGYGGLDWSNFYAFNPAAFGYTGTGYNNGVVSTPNVAYDGGGDSATISSATLFTLVSGDFTGAWNNGLHILVQGYNGASLVDSVSFVVNVNGPKVETFDWTGLTSVVFTPSGGAADPRISSQGAGEHFALDNLTINLVPEPAAWALMLAGFAGLGAALRARRSRLAAA
jgi:hypothetical protein